MRSEPASPAFPNCDCFRAPAREAFFHGDPQDTASSRWRQLLDQIAEAAADQREELSIPGDPGIVTLPREIGQLKSLRRLTICATWLVRLPVEIGDLEHLERLDAYMSYRLHWFPYELTRCRKLTFTSVSTRALYGNCKFRHPFPRLDGVHAWAGAPVSTCSVCRGPMAGRGARQVWLSAFVGTDVLPLLVHACSERCIEALPPGEAGYVSTPHRGGLDVQQPLSDDAGAFGPDGRLTAGGTTTKRSWWRAW